jgi:hypothetical protein
MREKMGKMSEIAAEVERLDKEYPGWKKLVCPWMFYNREDAYEGDTDFTFFETEKEAKEHFEKFKEKEVNELLEKWYYKDFKTSPCLALKALEKDMKEENTGYLGDTSCCLPDDGGWGHRFGYCECKPEKKK